MNESSNRLPDLYQLLGLVGLESDPQIIAAAIQQAASHARQAGGTDQTRAQKVVALAEKYLLDPARKQAYDQQWKMVHRSSATGVAALAAAPTGSGQPAPSEWDMSHLITILPGGDPQSPFNMATYLGQSQTRDPAAAEAELQRLMALLSQESSAIDSQLASDSVVPRGIENGDAAGVPSINRQPQRGSKKLPPATPGSFATRMRQKQQRALIFGGIGLGVGIIALLGLGLFLSRGSKPPVAERPKRPANGIDSNAVKQQSNPDRIDTGGSNLGALPLPGEQPQEIQAPPLTPPMPDGMPAPPGASPPSMTATPSSPASAPKPETSLSVASPITEQPPSSTPPTVPANTPPPAKPAAMEVQLTAADKEAWQKGMLAARELMGQQDFEGADKQLASLTAFAKTAKQREQLERLMQISAFVKEIRQALVQAIQGLAAAETFQIGTSTQASFVEGDAEKLTVKVAGQNRTYKLKEIPLNMAMALVDLKLDVVAATTKARKGAFVLVHPNKTMLERGKQWMLEAADAGAITKELAQFYTDDYSLP